VCVLGLHKSGTHALARYLHEFFDVNVQPAQGKNEGVVNLESCCLWKHTIPLDTLPLPPSGSKGAVTVLLTVREVVSWMLSLSRHPYEIFPAAGGKRKQHSLDWMVEEVEMRTDSDHFRNPFADTRFPSVMDLWATYIHGYLEGRIAPDGGGDAPPLQVLVVRFEDLLQRPGDVVSELASLGLPRNAKLFSPIEESVSGTAESRSSILLREASCGSGLTDALRSKIALGMVEHSQLVDWLGYSLQHRVSLGAPCSPAGDPLPVSSSHDHHPAELPSPPPLPIPKQQEPHDYGPGLVRREEHPETPWCTFCRLWATDGHLVSKKHVARVRFASSCN